MALTENIRQVQQRIQEAALRAGRDPGEITLVAATKVQTSETIRQAIAGGIRVCGENRVQEFNQHWADGAYEGAEVTSSATCRRIRSNTWWGRCP